MAITNSNTTNQNQNFFDQFFQQQQNQTNSNTPTFEELMGGARQTNQAENDFLKLMGITNTEQVSEQPVNQQPAAVPSSETAQVQQMNADANATRDNLNQQADQISSNGAWSNLETSNEGTLIPNADSSNSSDATLIPNSGWSNEVIDEGYSDIPPFNPNRNAMRDGLTGEEKQRIIAENSDNKYMFNEQPGYQTIWEGKVAVSYGALSALENRGLAISYDISKTLNIEKDSGIIWEAARDRYPSTHPYADNYLKSDNEVYVVVKQKVPENTNTENTVENVSNVKKPTIKDPKNVEDLISQLKKMNLPDGGVALRNYIIKNPANAPSIIAHAKHDTQSLKQRDFLAGRLNEAFKKANKTDRTKLADSLVRGVVSSYDFVQKNGGTDELGRPINTDHASYYHGQGQAISDIVRQAGNYSGGYLIKEAVAFAGLKVANEYNNKGLVGGNLALAMGLNTVANHAKPLQNLFNSPSFRTDNNFKALNSVGPYFENTVNEALGTAARNGFGLDAFLGFARNANYINNGRTENGLYNYFNTRAVSISKSLGDGDRGFKTSDSLAGLFRKAMSSGRLSDIKGGVEKIIQSSFEVIKNAPDTTGIVLNNLARAMRLGAANYKNDYERMKSGWSSIVAASLGTAGAKAGIPVDIPTITSAFTADLISHRNSGKNDAADGLEDAFRVAVYTLVDRAVATKRLSVEAREKFSNDFKRP